MSPVGLAQKRGSGGSKTAGKFFQQAPNGLSKNGGGPGIDGPDGHPGWGGDDAYGPPGASLSSARSTPTPAARTQRHDKCQNEGVSPHCQKNNRDDDKGRRQSRAGACGGGAHRHCGGDGARSIRSRRTEREKRRRTESPATPPGTPAQEDHATPKTPALKKSTARVLMEKQAPAIMAARHRRVGP